MKFQGILVGYHSLITISLLFYLLYCAKCYDLMLDRNFGKKTFCLSDLDIASDSSGTQYSSPLTCIKACYEDEFDSFEKMSFLYFESSVFLSFDMDQIGNQPYSYMQVEYVHLPTVGINQARVLNVIPGDQQETATQFQDPTPLVCELNGNPSELLDLQYSTRTYVYPNIPIGLLPSVKIDLYDWFSGRGVFLRSILITRNCLQNCVKCSSPTSCSVCAEGFSKFTLDSGNQVCEVIGNTVIQNCQRYTTDELAQEVCRTCYPGYSLDKSLSCLPNIDPSPCLLNEYYESGECKSFGSVGYSENYQDGKYIRITKLTDLQIQQTYKCPYGKIAMVNRLNNYQQYSCRCVYQNCKWCSNIDSCDMCESGFTYNSSKQECEKASFTSNSFEILQVQTENGYEIRAKFDQPLLYSSLSSSDFELKIQNFDAYHSGFNKFEDDYTALFRIEMLDFAKNKEVTLQFTNKDFVNVNLLQNSEDSVELKAYVKVSESQKQAAETAKSVGEAVGSTVVGTLLIIAIISNFSAIVSTIDLTGFLYYLLYIEARFPINIVSFYAVFKNFQLDFIPNPFTDMITPGYIQLSGVRFMQSDTDGYFLSSTGQSVTIFLLIVIMYLIAKVLSKVDIPLISNYFKKSVSETWEFGGYFDAVWTIYIYLLIGVMMQFQSFDCSDTSCGWNYFIFSISFIVSFGVPLLIAKLIRDNPFIKDDQNLMTKLSSLIAGVRLFSEKEFKEQLEVGSTKLEIFKDKYAKKLTKYYMPILYLRKIVFALIIVCLGSSGYTQITLITLLNIGMTAYFLLLRPLDSKYENYKGAISEIVMIVYQILVGILIEDPDTQEETDRINIGWAAIGIISFVILWHTVGIIFDFLVAIWSALKAMIARKPSSKVLPITQKEELELMQQSSEHLKPNLNLNGKNQSIQEQSYSQLELESPGKTRHGTDSKKPSLVHDIEEEKAYSSANQSLNLLVNPV